MESQLPEGFLMTVSQEPEPSELVVLRNRLKAMIHWRDRLATELAKVDAEITADAGTFRTLNGDLVRPTLDQLRRMLFDDGKG